MELIATLANTVILVIIFLYQKNKNKLLEDRISEQSTLLKETKDVVTQQAQAIDSQKTVVDTALEYTKSFEISKVEEIIKREVDLEYKKITSQKDKEIDGHAEALRKVEEFSKDYMNQVIDRLFNEFITPMNDELFELFELLMYFPKDHRDQVIQELPDGLSDRMKKAFSVIDEKYPEGVPVYTIGSVSTEKIDESK